MKVIIAEEIIHLYEDRVILRFDYDDDLIGLVKELPGARWSRSMKAWHIPHTKEVIDELLDKFKGKAFIDYSLLLRGQINSDKEVTRESISYSDNNFMIRDLPVLGEKSEIDIIRFRKWLEANRYPGSTVRTYTSMIAIFLRFITPREASECTSDDIIKITDEYIIPRNLSYSYQNQLISAIKKFYAVIYKSVLDPVEIKRPRVRHRLPEVLSREEVKKLLDASTNEKHRVMLSVLYACGLRRSELLGLKHEDIERERHLLRVRQSKGFRDRIVPLSDKIISMIDDYRRHYNSSIYLFEGQWPGEAYSATSLGKVLKSACKKAGIKKSVTLHWLRHSYATHLLESGTDIRYIQVLLGHKSSRTTEIYTHVTTRSIQNIKSPFDDL